MPAPDAAALMWKLDYLFGPNSTGDDTSAPWSMDVINVMVSDVRRLTGREA